MTAPIFELTSQRQKVSRLPTEPPGWPAVQCKYVCMVITYSKGKDQPGKVANPARGQLNRANYLFSCPRSRLRIWSRETGSVVPSRVSPLISILRLNLVLTYGWIPPEFRKSIHNWLLPWSPYKSTREVQCLCVCFLPIHSGHQVRWT